ncbi:helicase HerA-like C-terminal domain-containing protein [Ahrensia marina]|uniref:helicase HerA-like C-terminal domain-containing protein n=1 Tax=Ahrensia marina TaxID=1514904 RepID=UPI0035D00FD8
MYKDDAIYLGTASSDTDTPAPQHLALKLANRHGLITGATGTGKTVTLQIMAEGFSRAGVPVFCADVKGDLSGIAVAGTEKDFLEARAETIGFKDEYTYEATPTIFWDLFGEKGHPIRTTISEMGPLLLSRLMDLNETQEGVLNIAFRIADEEGLMLLDLKDLRAMLLNLDERKDEISAKYGNVSTASIGAIQRRLLVLEDQGGANFFGEPALKIADFMRTHTDGRGIVSVLAADKLMNNPRLYATFLLWLLSELFEELPEVGNPDKPRVVFFFDEAHLLFDEAPKALLERVEQVCRLIRSKGVGVYFVTQNPLDVPDEVLSQIGNRVQHALRAFTPRDQRAVKAAAETFRPNPELDAFEVITQLGVGEALVSTLEKKGVPSIVQRTLIRPPSSRLGPLEDDERAEHMKTSPVLGQYDEAVDRESAYEILKKRGEDAAAAEARALQEEEERKAREKEEKERARRRDDYEDDDDYDDRRSGSRRTRSGFDIPEFGPRSRNYDYGERDSRRTERRTSSRSSSSRRRRSSRQTPTEAMMKSIMRSAGTQIGRAVVRGILGSLRR